MKFKAAALKYSIGDRVKTQQYVMPEGTIAGYIFWPTDNNIDEEWAKNGKPPCYLVVDDDGYQREIFEGNIKGVVNA